MIDDDVLYAGSGLACARKRKNGLGSVAQRPSRLRMVHSTRSTFKPLEGAGGALRPRDPAAARAPPQAADAERHCPVRSSSSASARLSPSGSPGYGPAHIASEPPGPSGAARLATGPANGVWRVLPCTATAIGTSRPSGSACLPSYAAPHELAREPEPRAPHRGGPPRRARAGGLASACGRACRARAASSGSTRRIDAASAVHLGRAARLAAQPGGVATAALSHGAWPGAAPRAAGSLSALDDRRWQ